MKENITRTLSRYIEKIQYEDLPLSVVDTAKKLFMDFLAVSIAGFHRGPLAKVLYEEYWKKSSLPESTIIGSDNHKMSAIDAALMNGVSGHSLDLDDGHREAKGHPGVTVIPAVLALTERENLTGKDLILAMVVGYEIFIRLGKAANPYLFNKGFHTTGICGTLAAAAGTSKLLSLNSQQVESSLGIAGTQCSGLLSVTHTGQMIKPLNAGKAAQSGLLSSLLAARGAKGSENIIECEDGFLQAFAEKSDSIKKITDNLGEDFAINKCYIKLYPSCRHTHAAIDAALDLKRKYGNNLNVKTIDSIEITTYPAAIKLTKKDSMPTDEAGTRFNIGFAVCLALIEGKAGIDDFSEKSIKNQRIAELFKRVKIIEDAAFESKEKNIRGAKVKIKMKNDPIEYEKTVHLPKGEFENPASLDDVKNKFYNCAYRYYSEDEMENLINYILELDKIVNMKLISDKIK